MEQPAATVCTCGHDRDDHPTRLECDSCGSCEKYVSQDSVCWNCGGAGVLGNVRNADYEGRKCQTCGGVGYAEAGPTVAEAKAGRYDEGGQA